MWWIVFRFFARAVKEGPDIGPDVLKKESYPQHSCNDDLYEVTPASGIDIEQVMYHRYFRFVLGVMASSVSYISRMVLSISSRCSISTVVCI